MGRLLASASTERLSSTATPIITVKPLSLACWYKPTALPSVQAVLLALESNTTANRQFMVAVTSTGQVQAIERGSAGVGNNTTTTMSAGAWAHCGASFASPATGPRIAYLNGAATGSDGTSSGTAPVPERTDIGAFYPSVIGTFGSLANGIIAECAVWNVVLTPAEFMALGRGVNPRFIRPGALKFYAPLWGSGSPEPDYTAGQRALTPSGTLGAAHPRVTPPFAFGGTA